MRVATIISMISITLETPFLYSPSGTINLKPSGTTENSTVFWVVISPSVQSRRLYPFAMSFKTFSLLY